MIGGRGDNGFLLAIIEFCAAQYGWSVGYITEEVSLTVLLLLMRQKLFNEDKGIALSVKEELKAKLGKMSWEELVKENRKRLADYK